MKLGVARLCLDCEEVHDAQQCPICASETFAYLTRWVPHADPHRPARQPVKPVEKPTKVHRFIYGGGALSLVAYGLIKWSQRIQKRLESAAERQDTGELR